MNRFTTALSIAALAFVAACGADTTEAPEAKAPATATTSATPTAEPPPEFRSLSKKELKAALLTVSDMPVGFSQDPPEDNSGARTFCAYEVPFEEKVYVSRDFSKGGGMSGELVRLGLRQYKNADQAKAAFDALTKTLDTCTTETVDGVKFDYSLMAAPKVGDGAVGVKIAADGMTLVQNFALVGPVMVNTGGGGLVQTDADEVASLFEQQVKAYEDAAR